MGKLRFEVDADGLARDAGAGAATATWSSSGASACVSGADEGPGLEGECGKLGMWLLSAGDLGEAGDERSRVPTALRLEGSPSVIRRGKQTLEARIIDVALDARGEPERLATEGLTRVTLRGQDGLVVGRLKGRDGVLWTREGRLVSSMLGAFGPCVGTLALLQPNWPEERLTFIGPAELELDEAFGRGLEKATAEDGLVVLMAWRFGRLEPFLSIGAGETRLHMRLPGGGPATARGNGGFTLLRELGSDRLAGAMGSLERSREQRFEFVSQPREGTAPAERVEDRIEGRGWLRFSVEASDPTAVRWRLQFDAGLQQELWWQRVANDGTQRIEGVKTAVLTGDPAGESSVDLDGLPLRYRSSEAGLDVRAETCRRVGLGPWQLQGMFDRVEVVLQQAGDDARSVLLARKVSLSRLPDAWGRLWLTVHAEGEVQLSSRLSGATPRMLDLDCDTLDYLPVLASPALDEAMASVLGPGSACIVPSLLGSGRGVIDARGSVRLSLKEGDEDHRSLRSLAGEHLRLEGDAMASVLRPAPGGEVEVVIVDPGRARITARADLCRTRGNDIELGHEGGARPEVEVVDIGHDERTFVLESAAPVRYLARIARAAVVPADCGEPAGTAVPKALGLLSFPGPVKGRRLDGTADDRVGIECSDSLLVQLVSRPTQAGPVTVGRSLLLPDAFDRVLAVGAVRFAFQELEAEADRLGFGARSGWMRLAATGEEPVRVRLGQDFHAACHPSFAYNLWTYEQNAGRFVLRSGAGAGRGDGR
ncbi:MAG: hypothetical protein R3F30_05560 [Planctomycetota bacterium]